MLQFADIDKGHEHGLLDFPYYSSFMLTVSSFGRYDILIAKLVKHN